MSMEIERRFLVQEHPSLEDAQRRSISQFYLTSDPDRAVRVRLAYDATPIKISLRHDYEILPEIAELCIKGSKKAGSGIEVEAAITRAQAEALKPLAIGRPVDKMRYLIPLSGELVAELDIFDAPTGLKIVEVEFRSPEAARQFTPPSWFGKEITDDPRYSNQAIALGLDPHSQNA